MLISLKATKWIIRIFLLHIFFWSFGMGVGLQTRHMHIKYTKYLNCYKLPLNIFQLILQQKYLKLFFMDEVRVIVENYFKNSCQKNSVIQSRDDEIIPLFNEGTYRVTDFRTRELDFVNLFHLRRLEL